MELSRIESILTNECVLTRSRPIVVGVSGGADSLCLLHILNRLGFPVIVAHVNHRLRDESDAEEALLEQTAHTLGLVFKSTRVDVQTFSHDYKLSIEESARQLRYEFLFSIANESSAQALAVAHHADDQVETVLMHILRGAGPAGVKGMAYRSYLPVFSSDIPIVRPLLGSWRGEIDDYCTQERLLPSVDQTNNDTRYFRNRIRHELVPNLETYNPQAKQHLWQLAMLMQPEDALLDQIMKESLNSLITCKGKGFFAFKKGGFNGIPLPIKRRLIRQMIAELRSELRDVGFDAVEKGIDYIGQTSPRGECQLLENVWMTEWTGEEMLLFTGDADFCELYPVLNVQGEVALIVPGNTVLNDSWEVSAIVEEGADFTNNERSDDEVSFDLGELSDALLLRVPKAGVKIMPFGKEPISQKLSDLFINLGILRRARTNWPLLYCGDRLLWAVGLRRAKFAPLDPQTKNVLRLKLQRRN
jgi:tRNA(Ile)-lysidine synthase